MAFIKRNNEILLLNREKDPWMGRWNGVGGKIEAGELITASVKREIEEETGFSPADYQLRFAGQMRWESNQTATGGMYLFVAELDPEVTVRPVLATREGVLAFKALEWILAPENTGVVDNVPYTIKQLLTADQPLEIISSYQDDALVQIRHQPLEATNIPL